MKTFLITLFCIAYNIPFAIAQKGPVTTNSRLVEFYDTYKTIDKTLSRESFCKSQYEDKDTQLLQYLYQIDANFPPISNRKRKRLTFLMKEFRESKDKNYRMQLFSSEMFSDADYWQLLVERELKPMIKALENMDWPRDRNVLINYLNDLRGQKYYSVTRQSEATDLITRGMDVLSSLNILLQTIETTDTQFRRLSQEARLQPALPKDLDKRDQFLGFNRVSLPNTLKSITSCQLLFLGTF